MADFYIQVSLILINKRLSSKMVLITINCGGFS